MSGKPEPFMQIRAMQCTFIDCHQYCKPIKNNNKCFQPSTITFLIFLSMTFTVRVGPICFVGPRAVVDKYLGEFPQPNGGAELHGVASAGRHRLG